MEDSTSIGNDFEMCPSGRNKGPVVVIMDKPSKVFSCNDVEECKEQVGDHLIANEETIKLPV